MSKITKKIKSSPHILLAEGNRFLSKVIGNKLLRRGFMVSLANDGQEAIDKITDEKFDLILLDLVLAKKNGLEVLNEIKIDKNLNTKIVMLLGVDKTSDIEAIKKLGVTDYIIKSDLSIDMVAQKIEKILNKN